MQDQHGRILGSKLFPWSPKGITVTVADAGGPPLLSSKYVAIRQEPFNGRIGAPVAKTNTGSASFQPPQDGTPVRVIFMSTADVPESVLDCFHGNNWGVGFQRVARVKPGVAIYTTRPPAVLDGDESILTGAIDDLNRAMVDTQGIVLAQLAWLGSSLDRIDTFAGFSDPPFLGSDEDPMSWWFGGGSWYVLVSPHDPRHVQTMTAVKGFVCPPPCNASPCGKDLASYLLDPASDYRLSRQGIALLRSAAYVGGREKSFYGW